MFVEIQPHQLTVKCRNHYPGFGQVKTAKNKVIYILGAPMLYRAKDLIGAPRDEVVAPEDPVKHCKSVALVDRLLKCDDIRRWGDYLDGHFLLVVEDREAGLCYLITDLGNSFHLYSHYSDSGNLVIFSTDLDRLAYRTDLHEDVDYVSIVEYLLQTSITFPHTFYRGISEVPYASCLVCRYQNPSLKVDEYSYWEPSCQAQESQHDINALAEQLRNGIVGAMEKRLSDKKHVGLFLSGGYDSRVLAELIAHLGAQATAITLSDAHNIETHLAQRVAEANGLKHKVFLRDLEFYPQCIDDSIRYEGPHINFRWKVYLGFREEIQKEGFDAVLGGYMSDSILKLHEANVRARYFCGRHLGTLEEFDPTPIQLLKGGEEYLSSYEFLIKPEILDEIRIRRRKNMAYWQDLRRDGSAWEWSFMWPFMRNRLNSNLTTNIFNFSGYEIYTDRSVVEVGRIAHPEIKLNGRLFNKAVFPLIKNSRDIPIAETMCPPKGPAWWREWKIAVRYILPRRWTFPVTPELKKRNPAATVLTSSNLDELWRVSQILENLRQEYNPLAIETYIMNHHDLGVFDHGRYGRLNKKTRLHFMYTLLYLDIWHRKRFELGGMKSLAENVRRV